MVRRKPLRCSFCGNDETEVSKLVAGPKVYICDRCVAAASRIMERGPGDDPQPRAGSPAWRSLLRRAVRLWGGGETRHRCLSAAEPS